MSGPILPRMGARAPFADHPWLFRELAIQGRISPDDIRRKIAASEFEAVLTSSDLEAPDALSHPFLVSPNLIRKVADPYAPAFAIHPGDDRDSLDVDLPRRPVGPTPPPIEAARRLAPESGGSAAGDGPG